MGRGGAAFDIALLLQIPRWRISLVYMWVQAKTEMWTRDRQSGTVLCLRFAETGRGFADKRKEHVTAQCDYHKERQEEGEKGSTKDLPGLSLYTSPLSFQWLMAHKWKQT